MSCLRVISERRPPPRKPPPPRNPPPGAPRNPPPTAPRNPPPAAPRNPPPPRLAFFPHLARRLSGPTLECMRECAYLLKTKQPRNLGYMKLAVTKITNRQIVSQLLKYFSEVQFFIRKLSCKRPLAHPPRPRATCSIGLFHEEASTRSRSQLLCAVKSKQPVYRLEPLFRNLSREEH